MNPYLGLLVLYVISGDGEVLPATHQQLAEWFDELGLDKGFLPARVRGVEAFRAATSNLTDEWDSEGVRYKLVVREVKRTADLVTRRLFATWSSEDGPQERRVADLQFFRPRRVTAGRIHGTEKFEVLMHQGLEDLDRERLKAVVERSRRQYQAYLTQLSPQAFRYMLRYYLLYLQAVSMRSGSGGTYFLPTDKQETVRKLRELARRAGPGCRLMFTPMVDDPEQRDMIRESVEVDIELRAAAQLREVVEWGEKNADRAPTTALLKSWRDEFGILGDLLVYFGDLLEAPFERAGARLEELHRAIDGSGLVVATRLRRQ